MIFQTKPSSRTAALRRSQVISVDQETRQYALRCVFMRADAVLCAVMHLARFNYSR